MIRFRPYPALSLTSLIGIAILLALGKWQLDRLDWKLALIAAAEQRAHGEPVPVGSLVGRPAKDIEYAHAAAEGEFLPGKEAYLFSQLEDGRVGFDVIAPLRLSDGRVLLVDRGFVPPEIKGKVPAPSGAGRITGLVRAARRPGPFTPAPDLEGKVWYDRDVAAIGEAMGLARTLPFILAADAAGAGGYPEGGHTRLSFRNDHLEYALTWFALAGVLLVIYLAYHAKRGRLGFSPGGK